MLMYLIGVLTGVIVVLGAWLIWKQIKVIAVIDRAYAEEYKASVDFHAWEQEVDHDEKA